MKLSRRELITSSLAAASPAARPNILVFMTDQESALLPGPANLPQRARLTAGAAHFQHAFCNTPQCSPARASLLTGREPHRAGVRTNVGEGSLGSALDPKIPTVGSLFRDNGWSTGYFGKWHLTPGTPKDLNAFGFSHFAGGDDQATVDAAADWIRGQKQPWLAWVSVVNPHDIYHIREVLEQTAIRPGVAPPPSTLSNLTGKPAEQRAYVDKDQGRITADFDAAHWLRYRSYYLNLLEKTDTLLGRVLDAAGDLSNTIAVYTSDHGDQLGGHGLPFKGPFMYEPLIRIPLFVRAPGRLKPGVRRDLVTQTDVAPTLAGLAGLRWPSTLDGVNLATPTARDAVFLEYYAKQKWVNPIRTIRTRRWKYNAYQSGNQELYDLQSDPSEMRDLAKVPAHAALRDQLANRLDQWWTGR